MGVLSAILGGTVAVALIPIAPMVIYGIEMNSNSKKRSYSELQEVSKKDQSPVLAGIDNNNNGIRDNVESYLDDNLMAPDIHTFAKNYIYKLQQSYDLSNVPADQRVQLLKEVELIEKCSPYLKEYLDKNLPDYPNSKINDDSIIYSLHFATQLSFGKLIQFIEHKEMVLVNTHDRITAKQASDKLAAEYKVGNVFKGYRGDQAKTDYCVNKFSHAFDMSGYVLSKSNISTAD